MEAQQYNCFEKTQGLITRQEKAEVELKPPGNIFRTLCFLLQAETYKECTILGVMKIYGLRKVCMERGRNILLHRLERYFC